MQRISGPALSSNARVLMIARLFERASYYGFRSILLIFLIKTIYNQDEKLSMEAYAMFTTGIYIAYLFGGFLGDFLLKTKNAILIGGIIQALVIFFFGFVTKDLVYPFIALYALGCGLYSPNILALFAKDYKREFGKLTAGFTLFYLMVNIGAFVGVLLVSYIYEKYGFTFGYVSAGFLALISALILFFHNKSKDLINESFEAIDAIANEEIKYHHTESISPINYIAALLVSTAFWFSFESISYNIQSIYLVILDAGIEESSKFAFANINFLVILPASLVLFFIFRRFELSLSLMLIFAFLICAILGVVVPNFSNANASDSVNLFLIYSIFMGIGELLIAPILMVVISKYSNPKYYASLFGVYLFTTSILIKAIHELINLIPNKKLENTLSLAICSVSIIALFIYYVFKQKQQKSIPEL